MPTVRLRSLCISLVAGAALSATALEAQKPPCTPCAGIVINDPSTILDQLAATPSLTEDQRLYVAWDVDPAAERTVDVSAIREAGGTPWPIIGFRAPTPLLENLDILDAELQTVAALAAATGPTGHVQIDWRPEGRPLGPEDAIDLAFLIKRAAVTITGANTEARVIVGPLPLDATFFSMLYGEEIIAYVDGIALANGSDTEIEEAIEVVGQLDPGRSLVLDHLQMPQPAVQALADAARNAERGFAVTLFRAAEPVDLGPLKLLAGEFSGDLSFDPYSVPTGGREAWSFVRGEDLALQVIVELESPTDEIELEFSEPRLRDPRRILADGEVIPLLGARKTKKGFSLTVADPDPVTVLRVQRLTAAEIEGIQGLDEQLTVESQRSIPVGEILRRLQAFEDNQARRIDNYLAINTLSLRLQGTSDNSVDITFEGDYFFSQGEGYDWAWQRFFVNGVSWRNQRVPQIPLLQPEKAAAAPTEITFTKDYRYSLRGTAVVEGRDCWVIDFEPARPVSPGDSLYQGTVWVDREIYSRVKTRSLQLGLRGDAISNDETVFFLPLDQDGEAAEWSRESYVLPTHTRGQQIFSILNASLVVERELRLTQVRINPADFEERRQAILASDATMVRDTDRGLRYLVADKETGERVVQEELDATRLFLLGGVFYDEAQDYPLPLAGVNWISFDFKGTGGQANVFFAGLLAFVDIATPSLWGSRWEGGIDAFMLAVAGTDTLYSEEEELTEQDVEVLSPNIDLTVGRNIGSFFKLQMEYSLGWKRFSRADDTDPTFVIPTDHIEQRLSLFARYSRKGYRFRAGGGTTYRDEWEAWGFEDNPDFDPDKDVFSTWGFGLAKTWHLPNFFKFGAEIEYVDGDNLDRFSKYQFGPFSDIRVRGYRSELIRAEEAWAAHFNYGFNLGEIFQLRLVADTAWATDEASGLDNEFLAGVGVVGTFVGPWRTIINLDVGKAVAGPDDSVTLLLGILKLFS